MQAPDFWWTAPPTLAARALAPVGTVYGAITGRRMRLPGTRLGAPVLCVGNLVAGGAGKTPTALALAGLLARQGLVPAFVSRGYGRRNAGGPAVHRVDAAHDTVDRVGDEPLLLARQAPTYVGVDRIAAARQAAADGATLVVLDDGLQNPGLRKDLALAVIDGARGLGNGLCLPAGPLRAPLAAQWPLVSAVCVIGAGENGRRAAERAREAGKPVWSAALVPDGEAVERLRGKRLYAFAGIGHPPKFFGSLSAHGLDLAATRAFPDHHRFTTAELTDLCRDAQRLGATLVTTEKDRVRLPPGFEAETLPVNLVFADEAAVAAALGAVLKPAAEAS